MIRTLTLLDQDLAPGDSGSYYGPVAFLGGVTVIGHMTMVITNWTGPTGNHLIVVLQASEDGILFKSSETDFVDELDGSGSGTYKPINAGGDVQSAIACAPWARVRWAWNAANSGHVLISAPYGT